MTLVIKKGEQGWLIYKVRKSKRTRLRIAPLKTLEEARAIAVFGLLTCKEVTRVRYERLEGKTVRFDEHTPHNIGVPRRDVGSFKLRGVWARRRGARVCLILPYSLIKTQKDKSARVLLEIPVDRDFIIYAATRTFFLPTAPGDFMFHSPAKTDGRGE